MAVVWNQTHDISKVCPCMIFAHVEVLTEEWYEFGVCANVIWEGRGGEGRRVPERRLFRSWTVEAGGGDTNLRHVTLYKTQKFVLKSLHA